VYPDHSDMFEVICCLLPATCYSCSSLVLVFSRLDYGSAILAGLPKQCQAKVYSSIIIIVVNDVKKLYRCCLVTLVDINFFCSLRVK